MEIPKCRKLQMLKESAPTLYKELGYGGLVVEKKKRFEKKFLKKRRLLEEYLFIWASDLDVLGKGVREYSEKGHEMIKSCDVVWLKDECGYAVTMTLDRNPNSSYLKLKKSCEELQKSMKKLNDVISEDSE